MDGSCKRLMSESPHDGVRLPTRREFVAALCSALALAGLAPTARAAGGLRRRAGCPVVIFSKHLQWLDYAAMARMAATLGFDGIDLTVRPAGHVLPENVEDDLPRAVEAVRAAGLSVPTITTAISDPDDPLTERILSSASELGIQYYRLGYWTYDLDRPIVPQLDALRAKAKGIADMNRHFNLSGDYQNHAGARYVGASIWDLWEIIGDLDPDAIGCQFDVRHATVEGGTAWPVAFKLIAPRIHTVVAKDFTWRHGDEGWEADHVPLGYGAVDFDAYFPMLKELGFDGPVIVHYEYPLGGANHGAVELEISEDLFARKVEADLAQVRYWLSRSGRSDP